MRAIGYHFDALNSFAFVFLSHSWCNSIVERNYCTTTTQSTDIGLFGEVWQEKPLLGIRAPDVVVIEKSRKKKRIK